MKRKKTKKQKKVKEEKEEEFQCTEGVLAEESSVEEPIELQRQKSQEASSIFRPQTDCILIQHESQPKLIATPKPLLRSQMPKQIVKREPIRLTKVGTIVPIGKAMTSSFWSVPETSPNEKQIIDKILKFTAAP